MIDVRALRKEYPVGDESVVALERIDLAVPRGQICCIFGESGSGKSTLLNQLAGLEKPTRGSVRIGGVPVSSLNERELAVFRQLHLGFVFQSYNLLPTLNAIENVAMPLMFRGVSRQRRERAARAMLERVGLKGRMGHYPAQMSGGQQQRVGIARALAASPDILLMDEPFSAVDAITRSSLQDELKRIHERTGITVLFVTHDIDEAFYLGDRVLVMEAGRAVQYASPHDILSAPAVPFVDKLVAKRRAAYLS